MNKFTITEVIKITGVSKRTLHYYDEIGLLVSQKNEDNNYRIYELADLIKLQKILMFKEIGLSLAEIKEVIDENNAVQKNIFVKHKANLESKISSLTKTLENVERILEGEKMEDIILESDNMKNLAEQYEKEAEIKYSGTDTWQSYKKIKNSMSKAEYEIFYKNLEKEMNAVYTNLALNINEDASSSVVQKDIGKLFVALNKTMDCSKEVFYYICLGYVEDERFRKYFEQFGVENLPEFILEGAKVFTNK